MGNYDLYPEKVGKGNHVFRNRNQDPQDDQPTPRKRGRRLFYTLCVGLGLAAAVGIATAQFTTNDSPWADVTIASTQHLQSTATVNGAVWPGDCNDVVLAVYNPNPHAVTVTGIGNTGFRNSSDNTASENGNANRLEDFLYQADVHAALNGKVIPANGSKTLTVPNAVCLRPQADDARQGDTIQAGYFIAVSVNAGTEATG